MFVVMVALQMFPISRCCCRNVTHIVGVHRPGSTSDHGNEVRSVQHLCPADGAECMGVQVKLFAQRVQVVDPNSIVQGTNHAALVSVETHLFQLAPSLGQSESRSAHGGSLQPSRPRFVNPVGTGSQHGGSTTLSPNSQSVKLLFFCAFGPKLRSEKTGGYTVHPL